VISPSKRKGTILVEVISGPIQQVIENPRIYFRGQ
jgi:hypothetical protein